jgi:probable rRNA maturation factor
VNSVKVELDNGCPDHWVPQASDMETWLTAASRQLARPGKPLFLSIRVVDEAESAALNRDYRGKDSPTNVLSFSCELPDQVLDSLARLPLGDLAICAPVVLAEASAQGKSREAHWAHLLTHGFLHLHGYRHETPEEAEAMESLETDVLKTLGFPNPYLIN